ncbi:MAG: ASCH domain-containing protein [Myxococcota bacterium]|jgi:N4-acetylcytidine amidohydrolase|nr:ASCH domain-containing protein [Myxococcota bacterium]
MSDFPEKTCTIDRLVRQKMLVTAALAGTKTEQRRDGVYAYPGETFELEGRTFEVTSLTHEPLGNLDDEGARAEGFQSLEQYRQLILRMHKGMEWEPEHLVWVHRFKLLEAQPA